MRVGMRRAITHDIPRTHFSANGYLPGLLDDAIQFADGALLLQRLGALRVRGAIRRRALLKLRTAQRVCQQRVPVGQAAGVRGQTSGRAVF